MRRARVMAGAVLAAAVLVPLTGEATLPALAAVTDDTTRDVTVVASDGTPLSARILAPDGALNPTMPSGGWPLILHLHGAGSHRCYSGSPATRKELAEAGYIVVSFNGRGHPASAVADINDSGATCSSVSAQVNDGLDDTGSDWFGPRDIQDVKDVLTTILDYYQTAGCGSPPCVNANKVGAMGTSGGAWRSAILGLPGVDSRIKAVVPVAPGMIVGNYPSEVSNYPTERGHLSMNFLAQAGSIGRDTHFTEESLQRLTDIYRNAYSGTAIASANVNSTVNSCPSPCNTVTLGSGTQFDGSEVGQPITIEKAGPAVAYGSVNALHRATITAVNTGTQTATFTPAAAAAGSGKRVAWGTQAWMELRSWVDDDARINQAQYVNTPIMLGLSFLESPGRNGWGPMSAMAQGWQEIPGEKYLYYGTCGHGPDPCEEGSDHNIKFTAAVLRFFDRYVKGNTGTFVGGTVMNASADTTASSDVLTVASGSEPQFTAADVGRTISVTGAGPSGATLVTTIDGFTNGTTVSMAANASGDTSDPQSVSWLTGNTTADTTASSDVLTIAGGSAPVFTADDVGKTISITGAGAGGATLTTTIDGYTSGTTVSLATNASGDTGSQTATWVTPCEETTCVMYQIPRPYVSVSNNPLKGGGTNSDDWTWQEDMTWPPSAAGTPAAQTLYLKRTSGGTNSLSTTAPSGSDAASQTITSTPTDPITVEYCKSLVYTSGEYAVFDYTFTAEKKAARFEADLVLSSDTSRFQVVADIWNIKADGTETRITSGGGLNIPVIRTGYTAGNKVHVTFLPTQSAWTFQNGDKIRLIVASRYSAFYPNEPVPSTNTVYHNPNNASEQSKITLKFAA